MHDALPPEFAELLRKNTEHGYEQEKALTSLREAVGAAEFDSQPQFEPFRRQLASFAEMTRRAELGMAELFRHDAEASTGLLETITNKNKCASCGVMKNDEMRFYKCARCKATHYCSKECQKDHWKSHKKECALKGLVCAEIARNM